MQLNTTQFRIDRNDKRTLINYDNSKDRLAVKADGSLAKYRGISYLFQKFISCFTKTSFNRDRIRSKVEEIKTSSQFQTAKVNAGKNKSTPDEDKFIANVQKLIGSDEPVQVGTEIKIFENLEEDRQTDLEKVEVPVFRVIKGLIPEGQRI